MKWRFSGLRNPFASLVKPELWGPPFLAKSSGNVRELAEEHWKGLMERLSGHPDLQLWLQKRFPQHARKEYSLLLPQILYMWDSVDPFEEISLYAKIIQRELVVSSATLIVKPHPRDSLARLALLKTLVPETNSERIIFLEPDMFSALPAELLLNYLPIRSVVGFFSTSMLAVCSASNLSVRAYTSPAFSIRLRKKIERLAYIGDYDVIEL
ncbi:MAG: polysialyltransferase family glycosyltransferase [Pseudomonadota bacterium]